MSRQRWGVSLTVVAIAAFAAGGCGRSASSSGSATGSAGHPPTTVGFDGKSVSVGILTVQSGPAAVIGNPWTEGNLAYFKRVNASGGIAGKYRIKPVVSDTGLDTTRGVQQYNAMKGRVALFGNVLGTVVDNAVLPQLKRDGLAAVPGSLDSLWVHEPNLAPWGSPYQIEAINGLEWYRAAQGTQKTICTAAQDDTYGQAAEAGAAFSAKHSGYRLAAKVRFQPTDTDFTAPVAALRRAHCDAVLLATTPTGVGGLLGKAASEGFAPQWIGEITTWNAALGKSKLASYLQAHLAVVGDGPAWGDTSVPGMRDMVADMKKYAPGSGPDLFFEQGYTQAQVTVQLLQAAVRRGDLSHAGLLATVAALSGVSFGGLSGQYTYGAPDRRSPPRVNTIFRVVPNAPTGLRALKLDQQSEAATKFDFTAGA